MSNQNEPVATDGSRAAGLSGSCECGGVSFIAHGDTRGVVNCHCSQCLKTHGHVAAYTSVDEKNLEFTSERTLNWYDSSGFARRGFCNVCGASIFWKHNDEDSISISAGMFEQPTGLATVGHIFVATKGDYYDIDDQLPQLAGTGSITDT